MHEKLVELLAGYSIDTVADVEFVADHLIANGVTIQKWIPVTERLPDNCKDHLCLCNIDGHTEYPFAMVLRYYLVDEKPHFQHESEHGLHVTHWMPIPEPPKVAA